MRWFRTDRGRPDPDWPGLRAARIAALDMALAQAAGDEDAEDALLASGVDVRRAWVHTAGILALAVPRWRLQAVREAVADSSFDELPPVPAERAASREERLCVLGMVKARLRGADNDVVTLRDGEDPKALADVATSMLARLMVGLSQDPAAVAEFADPFTAVDMMIASTLRAPS